MALPKVAIVTTTFLTNIDDLRFKLAMKTLDALVAEHYDVYVVDGSTDQAVIHDISSHPICYLRQTPGTTMGGSRRQAIQAGYDSGADYILWMEPEKYPLVPQIWRLVEHIVHHVPSPDLVIPRRRSLRSYPAFQMAKELEGNHEMASLTGRSDLDAWFGPRLMNRYAAEFFLSYDGRYGDRWESIFIPVIIFLRCVGRTESVTVDYTHPAEQTAAETSPEFDAKRVAQLDCLLQAMTQYYQDNVPA